MDWMDGLDVLVSLGVQKVDESDGFRWTEDWKRILHGHDLKGGVN
jgi:hypothetical protein